MVRASRIAVFAAVVVSCVAAAACGKEPPKAPPAESTAGVCPNQGARECKEATDCGGTGNHCTGGRCYANHAGCPCSAEGDCGGGAHCTKGMCHLNQAGAPCTETRECGERAHCTAGSCYSNATGSPCSEPNDCGPGSSCVSGTCN